jgi:hypothetical protein
MKLIVPAILFAIGLAGQTPPSCSLLLQAPEPDSRYAFTQAGLVALSYARAGWQEADAFQAEQKAENSPQTVLIGMMRNTKTASEAYACAETVLEPYKKVPRRGNLWVTASVSEPSW